MLPGPDEPRRRRRHDDLCLKRFGRGPGPNAVVHTSGTLPFRLRFGTVSARVRSIQRFAADGIHARQTLTGTVTGGTGRYRGARGTIAGGGTDVESPPGHIVRSNLRYVLSLHH